MRGSDRAAGAALVAAAAGTLFAMGHHPSGAHGGGGLAGAVHAAMILLLAAATFGFAHFARRRGLDRPAMLAGLVAYGVALAGHVGAATTNGFVVPALAARGGVGHDIFLFAWEANQALARLGVFATGAAYLLWSADLLRDRGTALLLGLAGLAAGAIPSALLLAGAIRMDVAGAFVVYALQVGWAALVGIALIRGSGVAPDAPAD